jgi:hypothetical protein
MMTKGYAHNKKFGENAGLTLRNINFCFTIVQ